MKTKESRKVTLFAAIFMTIASIAGLCACTQSGGRIGIWFGSWLVESIEIDGAPDPDYPVAHREIMISFQGHIFNLAPVDGLEVYGSWEESDGNLRLDADFTAKNPEWPSALGFGDDAQLTFKILKRDRKDLRLQLHCPDGHVRVYKLRHLL